MPIRRGVSFSIAWAVARVRKEPVGEVGVADAVELDDAAAAGQVRAVDELHQVVQRAV